MGRTFYSLPALDVNELNSILTQISIRLDTIQSTALTLQTVPSDFGDVSGGNYASFEDDGTLTFVGNATVWDDVAVAVSSARAPASGSPTWTAYKGSEVQAFSASATNSLKFSSQLYHRYKVGSTIEFHLHLAYPNANAGNSVWSMSYSWATIGGTFPTETTITETIAAPEETDHHQIAVLSSSIDGTDKGISSVLLCNISRLGGDPDDDYGSSIYLVSMDFHIECDTVGSRERTSK